MAIVLLTFGGLMLQMELGRIAHMSSRTTYYYSNGDKDGREAMAATISTLAPTTLFREEYFSEEDGIFKGILSTKPKDFFQKFQEEIDEFDLAKRCRRYGFGMTAKEGQPERPHRLIFYGALITEEPWELLDIIATETHGIFEGMVFVESNRTQTLSPRPIRRANKQKYIDQFKEMFQVEKLQIREFVDEENRAIGLIRENNQRAHILKGWKELGMTKDDIGYIADTDESFTRDFLRAAQQCPYVEYFDYEVHKCANRKTKLFRATRVFESSPECVTKDRSWFHPDMVIGACVEEIGDESVHPRAQRLPGLFRAKGWASTHKDVQNLPDNSSYPLFSAGDFRMLETGGIIHIDDSDGSSGHAAFHLHNFFAHFNTTRHKYLTYGHPNGQAMTQPLEDLSRDLRLLVRCVYNQTDGPIYEDADDAYDDDANDDDANDDNANDDNAEADAKGNTNEKANEAVDAAEWQGFARVKGGLDTKHPVFPIYFHDEDYRRRKHESIVRLVKEDEYSRVKRLNLTDEELEVDELVRQVREAKRFIWANEARIHELQQKTKGKRR
jgi:Glycosyltransferase family 17